MGGSCCEKKPVCNRKPLEGCKCKKEKKDCCKKEEKKSCGCYHKEEKKDCGKCQKDEKCLTASELMCIIQRIGDRRPPFPPTPRPPVPPNPVTFPIPADTPITFDDDTDLWVFNICVPVQYANAPFGHIRFGTAPNITPWYPVFLRQSAVNICLLGTVTIDVILNQATGDALVNGGFIVGGVLTSAGVLKLVSQ